MPTVAKSPPNRLHTSRVSFQFKVSFVNTKVVFGPRGKQVLFSKNLLKIFPPNPSHFSKNYHHQIIVCNKKIGPRQFIPIVSHL